FLAGDAAAVLDPASSHGVLRGVMSGMFAAHLIEAILLRGLAPEAAARHYAGWLRDGFVADVGRMRSLYSLLPRPPGWL
ncbi:MAG: FAD-dependent oxidoreductase, partial [Planctomycetia bacterium]|nr:FAD-dependent oxidoreductase [Planctomycetia bacterium]